MEVQQPSMEHLQFDHLLWLNELRFFEAEMKLYESRLEDIAIRYSDREIMAKVEQFQNKFIRQKDVLDALKHDIRLHEQTLARISSSLEPLDGSHNDYHQVVQDKIDTHRKLYTELKNEYRGFVNNWL